MISVVIPNYNRRDFVLALLRDVHAQEASDFEVIVVDDCSPDDSVEMIRREFPQVRVLINESNSGPSVTRNRGVLAAKGDVIVGFDSDVTIPDRHLLRKIEETIKMESAITCLALRILKPDGRADDVERWCHPLPIESADRRFLTSYFSGTAYAVKKDSMIRAGLYPEIFYMHYEEVELALRLLNQGDSILHCPDLCVLHHASEISSRSYVETFYKPRNQILLALLSYPAPRAIMYIIPRMIYQLAVAVKGRHLKVYVSAICDGFHHAGAVLKIREPLDHSVWKRIAEIKRQSVNEMALPGISTLSTSVHNPASK